VENKQCLFDIMGFVQRDMLGC